MTPRTARAGRRLVEAIAEGESLPASPRPDREHLAFLRVATALEAARPGADTPSTGFGVAELLPVGCAAPVT